MPAVPTDTRHYQPKKSRHFHTQLFIIMLQSSKVLNNRYQLLCYHTGYKHPNWMCSGAREGRHRAGRHAARTQRKEVSPILPLFFSYFPSSSPGVKKEYFCMTEKGSTSKLTFDFPQIHSNRASSC